MRVLKLSVALAACTVLLASAALAGGAACGAGKTAACSAEKASAAGCTKASAATCTAKHTAACTGAMQNCKVEATRLSSGDLVVHYIGTTPEAVAFLQANAASSADKFCCPMTQKMASNDCCKVDMAKVSNGVIVFVSSPKRDVVDAYEKEFAAMTASHAEQAK